MTINNDNNNEILQHANYDQFWKVIIEFWVEDGVQYFVPNIANQINWDERFNFLQEELSQMGVGDSRLLTDKLIEFTVKDATKILLLLHIEIQASHPESIAKRMYNYGIKIINRFPDHELVSFILYIGKEKHNNINIYKPFKFTDNFIYNGPYYMLAEHTEESLEASNSPIAHFLLLTKWLEQNKNTGVGRLQTLKKFMNFLEKKDTSKKDIRNLLTFAEILVALPKELQTEFNEYKYKNNIDMASAFLTTSLMEDIRESFFKMCDTGKTLKDFITEGEHEGILKTARNFKSAGINHNIIAQATGLTLKEIEGL